jgi:hypothetical protein
MNLDDGDWVAAVDVVPAADDDATPADTASE